MKTVLLTVLAMLVLTIIVLGIFLQGPLLSGGTAYMALFGLPVVFALYLTGVYVYHRLVQGALLKKSIFYRFIWAYTVGVVVAVAAELIGLAGSGKSHENDIHFISFTSWVPWILIFVVSLMAVGFHFLFSRMFLR